MRRIRREEEFDEVEDCDDEPYESSYLGSFMFLDPCGRYHHFLSPNGATPECERYWENLNNSADELGMWIQAGEGCSTDIYLCKPVTQDMRIKV